MEDIAKNVRAYKRRSRLAMYVCGTCGTRDTDHRYPNDVKLTNLDPSQDHWLRVSDPTAFQRLCVSEWMRLAKPNLEDDTFNYVEV